MCIRDRRIRNHSSQEDIFYPHVEHILLGEDAARVSIEDYLAFFCRSPELRIDIPLYIVKGGTAEQAVLETGSDSRCISEILQTCLLYTSPLSRRCAQTPLSSAAASATRG